MVLSKPLDAFNLNPNGFASNPDSLILNPNSFLTNFQLLCFYSILCKTFFSVVHHSGGPKNLCAVAHLGCTCAAGASSNLLFSVTNT